MPLIIAPLEKELLIIKILADEKIKKHLENLGIIANAKIKKIAENGGSCICLIKDSRLALDQNIATKIIVS